MSCGRRGFSLLFAVLWPISKKTAPDERCKFPKNETDNFEINAEIVGISNSSWS